MANGTRRRVAAALAVTTIIGTVGASVATAADTSGGIGNRAWVDANANGRQDAGEPGLAGVRVTVSNLAGKALISGLTDSGGWWGIRNVSTTQCYRLTYTVPSGYKATPPPAAGTANGSTIGADGKVAQQICPTAVAQNHWDAGFVYQSGPPAAGSGRIGDRVVYDTNGNGGVDAGEPGVAGIPITLRDSNGRALVSGATTAGGWYGFTKLATDRCYVVAVGLTQQFLPTGPSINAGGEWTRPLCPTPAAPEITTVDFTVVNVPVGPTPPSSPSWRQTPGRADWNELAVTAKVEAIGTGQRLSVRLLPSAHHAADGTVTPLEHPAVTPYLTFAPPPGVPNIVPGRYSATRSLTSSSGVIGTDFVRCTDFSVDLTEIRTVADGTVTSLALTFAERCAGGTVGQVRINPQGNQNAPDRDGDDVPDTIDNCLVNGNPNQADIDSDGVGDACDAALLRRRVTVTSPAGEEVFRGGSVDATPANSDPTLFTIPVAPGGALVDANGIAVRDFSVAVGGSLLGVDSPSYVELWFRSGQPVLGSRTGTGNTISGLVYTTFGAEFGACVGATPASRAGSPIGTASTATTVTSNVTALTFDATRTAVTSIDASITQRCTPTSPTLTARAIYDRPL